MKRSHRIMIYSLIIIIPLLTLLSPSNSVINSLTQTEVIESQTADVIINYGISLEILHANYYDLDNDGNEDDILTALRIRTVSGRVEYVISELYQFLTLPSGLTYYFGLRISGWYSSVEITVNWFNVATESGWYEFYAYVKAESFNWYSIADDIIVFDPPEEGGDGGMPGVEVVIK